MNDAPMFRKTRVMSRIEGSHTLKLWLWCSTTTQKSILLLYNLYRYSTVGHCEVFLAYRCVEQLTEQWFAGTGGSVRLRQGLGELTSSEKKQQQHKSIHSFPSDNCL